MHPLDRHFPRYTAHDPAMPIWIVTPTRDGCLHRFFDSSPISPSGRYLAAFQMPFEDRQPEPGDRGHVVLVDLQTGEDRVLAETCGWESQMGTNINWGGSDSELYFNDVDTTTWTPFAWKLDPLTGDKTRLQGTVYHASPDGRQLVSANMATMRRTQPGYGVALPPYTIERHIGLSDDDGFWVTDTRSGERRLLASTRHLMEEARPAIQATELEGCEVYGFHCKYNAQGDRLMLSLRWYSAPTEPSWNMFAIDQSAIRFAWVTMAADGSGPVRCAVGPEQWEKGGHHATWFPDGRRISMNLAIDRDAMRFVQVNADGTELRTMLPQAIGSGHPTVHADGLHLVTDAYMFESFANDDGTTPLRWLDLQTGVERQIARIPTATDAQWADSVLRLDPHPAWDRNQRYLAFNIYDGTRRVCIADMQSLIG